jgi:ABC-type sugar transport system ATPase subunit
MISIGANAKTILELRCVTKRFAGTTALDEVDFTLRRGEIHALLGENGAGKSTLIKIVTGALRADRGELWLRGQTALFAAPRDAAASGITALPQEVIAAPHLSVGRNVLLGLEGPRASVDRLTASEDESVRWALREVGATFSPLIKAQELSTSDLRLVQIARTMLHVGDIVVMDEPTAVLSEPEAENLLRHLVSFRANGKAIVYVTHRLSEVTQIADRATILRDGRVVGTLERDSFDRTRLVQLMARVPQERTTPIAAAVDFVSSPPSAISTSEGQALEVVSLSVRNRFSDVSFSADSGQIVGIAGIQGSGHADILRALAGVVPSESGSVRVFGRSLNAGSIASAFNEGMLLVPADRRKSAILSKRSIQENIAVSRRVRRSCRPFGFRSLAEEHEMTSGYIRGLFITPPQTQALAGQLSGGNQQKVALARVLEGNARILLMDEPTQGIDVRSKSEIHGLLRNEAKRGRSVVVASSEFEELIGLSDIIHVMCLGRLRKTFSATRATYHEILHWALP